MSSDGSRLLPPDPVPGWPEAFRNQADLSFDRQLGIADATWWHGHFADRGGFLPRDLVEPLFARMPGDPRFTCRALDTRNHSFNIYAESGHAYHPGWRGCVVFELTEDAIIWDEIASAARGLRLGRLMARNILDLATRLGLRWIRISAQDIGSYLWAEAGFIPDRVSWLDMRRELKARWFRVPNVSEASAGILRRILNCKDADADPAEIRLVASLDDLVDNRFTAPARRGDVAASKERLGKQLLIGLQWRGTLDIGDSRHRRRLEEWLDMPAR